jgi:hypothetical protein
VWTPPKPEPPPEADETVDLSTVEISLVRTPAWTEPVYEVTIEGNGRVHYQGCAYVRDQCVDDGRVSERAVRVLVRKFEKLNFFELQKYYTELVFDVPSQVLSLRIGSRQHEVSWLWTHMEVDPFGEEVRDWETMQRLDALADAIDAAVDIEHWIGADEERTALFGLDSSRAIDWRIDCEFK